METNPTTSTKGYSIHVVDLMNDNETEKFEKSLNLQTKETSCGEKAIIYTINSLVSEVCNIVKKIEKAHKNAGKSKLIFTSK